MNYLEQIIAYKKKELVHLKADLPLSELVHSTFYQSPARSLKQAIGTHPNSLHIIAEFKRKSPSKGYINQAAISKHIVPQYAEAGATACSILTDTHFFGGTEADIVSIRAETSLPILRKDFIIDAYQIHATKAMGADVLLLIAACLTKKQIAEFTQIAHGLGLETMVEIHSVEEINHIDPRSALVGINNRNLQTFEVDLQTSIQLASQLNQQFTLIAESGLEQLSDFKMLSLYGFQGFLVGEYFMKQPHPASVLKQLLADYNHQKK